MIDKINLSTNTYKPTYTSKEATISHPSLEAKLEMPSEISNAYRAYGLVNVNQTPNYMSLKSDKFLTLLKQQGKVEGKDFIIEENGDRHWINVYNSKGQKILRSEYDDETQKLLGCEISTYKDDKLIRMVWKDSKNRTSMYENTYYNNEIPQENFTKEKLTYKTKPEDYIEYLKQNNITHKVHYDNGCTEIEEFDENNLTTQITSFSKNFISRSELNSNEEETRRIMLQDDSTSICNYIEKCKSNTYKTKDIKPEYFTRAQITYNTKPQEYINYLEQNNIQYKIKHAEDKNTKDCEIIEYNADGEKNVSTSWIYENGDFKRICRWEVDDNSRRRLDFSKDETDEMVIRY